MISLTLPLNISSRDMNTSLQVGDDIYFVQTSIVVNNSFLEDNNNLKYLGVCTAINKTLITVLTALSSSQWPDVDDYIMFQKNKSANSNGLKGYYADCIFSNNEMNEKIELFSINTQVQESSK